METKSVYSKGAIQDIPLPRFFSRNEKDANLVFDPLKIEFHEEFDDNLLVANLCKRKIFSSIVYPLIFDQENHEIMHCSMPFYTKTVSNPTLFESLTEEQKIAFCVGVRDLFIADQRNLLSNEESKLITSLVTIIDNFEPLSVTINGVEVNPYPTRSKKLARYVETEFFKDCGETGKYFASLDKLSYNLVFMNPQDLSFHNFENIINLNISPIFEGTQCEFTKVTKHPKLDIFQGTIQSKNLEQAFKLLDDLNIYSAPFNSTARGGRRFIFDCKNLTNVLDEGFSMVAQQKEFKSLEKNLCGFNRVFRFNKFEPNDSKFTMHWDTPYYDSSKNQASRYTLIIYVTGGNAKPVLKIDEYEINEMLPMSFVLFNQKYAHEGKAFENSTKIFLRTELIFTLTTKKATNEIKRSMAQKIFNIACFMNKESIFTPELEQYSTQLFNQAVMIRYNLDPKIDSLVYLHKEFKNIHFVTNGHDYYFPKFISKKTATVLILVDYFGAKSHQLSKYKVSKSKIRTIKTLKEFNVENVFLFLAKIYEELEIMFEEHATTLNDLVFATCASGEPLALTKGREDCCYYHHSDSFNPHRCDDVIRFYNRKLVELSQFTNATVSIFDGKLAINTEDIRIDKHQIVFPHGGTQKRINFAACWNDSSPSEFVTVSKKKRVKNFYLPPIQYSETAMGIHYTIDMFHNDLMFLQETAISKTLEITSSPKRKHSEDSDKDEESHESKDQDTDDSESDNESNEKSESEDY